MHVCMGKFCLLYRFKIIERCLMQRAEVKNVSWNLKATIIVSAVILVSSKTQTADVFFYWEIVKFNS